MTFRSDKDDIPGASSLERDPVSWSGRGLGGKSLSLLKAKLEMGILRGIVPCSFPDGLALAGFWRDGAGRPRRLQTGSEKEYGCLPEVSEI